MMNSFTKGIHYSTELERAILGACLLESTALGRVYGVLEVDHFYHTGNKIVFQSLREMYQQGMMMDILTLVDYIMRIKGMPQLEGYNTDYFIVRLQNDVVSTVHLEYHAYIIKQMWMQREIIKLTNSGVDINNDTRKNLADIQEKISALQSKATEHDWKDMTQLCVDLYRHQEQMKISGGVGKPSGFRTLDVENGGFYDGNLIVIASRPSVGKSALLSKIAVAMSKKDLTVGIVSLEMSDVEITSRIVAFDTNTDFNVVYRGLYRDQEDAHRLYERIARSTSTFPIYITDKTNVNVPEIRAKAEKLKALHGLDCLMIDYLQLIESSGEYNRNREYEVAQMSRGCKIMAKEMNIPVILLCQLNREVTKRKGIDRYPQLSDLRESGAIEQDADIVMFLHRDFMAGILEDQNGHTTAHEADLVIRKWRNGKANFTIPLHFDGSKMIFTERTDTSVVSIPAQPSFYERDDKTTDDEKPF